jgi:3-methylfumaryl-CoA hydratase
MSGADYSAWIGRSETQTDVLGEAPLRGLAALLDYDAPPWGANAPPLAHWLYFLPTAAQHLIDVDGHPKRGGFLPPVELPRRMWAGGRLTFHAPLQVGARVERVSTIADVKAKSGASGEMVFVTVRHVLRANGVDAVTEEQDIVYRGASKSEPAKAPQPDARAAEHERAFAPDATMLFRFSALTFNAHRIHYDLDYAKNEEGYPGLVVHGPYIATALMDHAIRTSPSRVFNSFQFRAQKPLFMGDSATLCRAGDDLWCRNGAGEVTMSAKIG